MKIQALTQIDRIAVQGVRFYQRHLSARKGFNCPSGRLYGDTTCSAAVRDILLERGAVAGAPLIAAQLKRCQEAAKQLRLAGEPRAQFFCCVLPIPV